MLILRAMIKFHIIFFFRRSCIKEAFERSKKKWKDGKHVVWRRCRLLYDHNRKLHSYQITRKLSFYIIILTYIRISHFTCILLYILHRIYSTRVDSGETYVFISQMMCFNSTFHMAYQWNVKHRSHPILANCL